MVRKTASLLACVGGLVAARSARADTYVTVETPSAYGYSWSDPRLASDVGVGIVLGGGVTGFTDSLMRNLMSSSVNGLWDARLSLGTHVPIGLDISYVGSAGSVTTINGASNGTLIGTTVEAALRFNILPHYPIDPYVFGGAGWTNYTVNNMQFSQADTGMKNSSNVAEFPMGAGVSFRDISGWLFDLRGTFRATTGSHLVEDLSTGTFAQVYSWEASAALGYEF